MPVLRKLTRKNLAEHPSIPRPLSHRLADEACISNVFAKKFLKGIVTLGKSELKRCGSFNIPRVATIFKKKKGGRYVQVMGRTHRTKPRASQGVKVCARASKVIKRSGDYYGMPPDESDNDHDSGKAIHGSAMTESYEDH